MTPERAPEPSQLGAIYDIVNAADPATAIVFNCQTGRARTTAAMISACIVQRTNRLLPRLPRAPALGDAAMDKRRPDTDEAEARTSAPCPVGHLPPLTPPHRCRRPRRRSSGSPPCVAASTCWCASCCSGCRRRVASTRTPWTAWPPCAGTCCTWCTSSPVTAPAQRPRAAPTRVPASSSAPPWPWSATSCSSSSASTPGTSAARGRWTRGASSAARASPSGWRATRTSPASPAPSRATRPSLRSVRSRQ